MVASSRGDSIDIERSEWIDQVFREVRGSLPAGKPEAYEAAFRLRVICGMSFPAIAAALGCSWSTAHRRVAFVRRVIREHLDESSTE